MRRRYREVTVFSLSMMDVICSAFGAVVVLMMLMSVRSEQARAAQERTKAQLDALGAQIEDFNKKFASARSAAAAARSAAAAAQSELDKSKMELARANLRTQFIGIGSNKKRWLILADMSGSMDSIPEALSKAVGMMVDVLPEDGAFNITGFKQGAPVELMPWRPARSASPVQNGRAVLEPVRGNREKAKRWVAEDLVKRFGGGTPTKQALSELLSVPGWEAIVLFTDGSPDECQSVADMDKCLGDMADELSELNARNHGVEIHCIGLGPKHYEAAALALFLEKLAHQNRGGYVGMGAGRTVAAVP